VGDARHLRSDCVRSDTCRLARKVDFNVLKLQSRGLESVDTEMRLLNADAESAIFAAVVCDDLAQTRVLQKRLSALPTVIAVHSIAELIPEDQEAKVPLIHEIRQRIARSRSTCSRSRPTIPMRS